MPWYLKFHVECSVLSCSEIFFSIVDRGIEDDYVNSLIHEVQNNNDLTRTKFSLWS